MVQGRKPDAKRRRRIQQLRARGLSLPAIGRRLGVTFQCIQRTIRRMAEDGQRRPRSVPCCACGDRIISQGVCQSDRGQALCLACLAELPDAPFGQRLRACRLAAGLSRSELTERCGLEHDRIRFYELQCGNPTWPAIVQWFLVQ